jgi:hypothetical protein
MNDATWTAQADAIDATWDYWATVEATDVAEIEGTSTPTRCRRRLDAAAGGRPDRGGGIDGGTHPGWC